MGAMVDTFAAGSQEQRKREKGGSKKDKREVKAGKKGKSKTKKGGVEAPHQFQSVISLFGGLAGAYSPDPTMS
jgi:hypothetical protein